MGPSTAQTGGIGELSTRLVARGLVSCRTRSYN